MFGRSRLIMQFNDNLSIRQVIQDIATLQRADNILDQDQRGSMAVPLTEFAHFPHKGVFAGYNHFHR